MALFDAHDRPIPSKEKRQIGWPTKERRDRLLAKYSWPYRLLTAIGVIFLLLDWKARAEEAVLTAHQLSGILSFLPPIVGSPWSGIGLILLSFVFAIFVPVETTLSLGGKLANLIAWTACVLSGFALWTIVVLASLPNARHLAEGQQTSLKRAFGAEADISSRLWIVSYPECFECRAYAWEFASTVDDVSQWANHKVGVLPFSDSFGVQLSTLWRGIIIGARDPKHLTDDQAVLTKALDAAHLKYSFESFGITIENGGKTNDAVVLLIAPQEG